MGVFSFRFITRYHLVCGLIALLLTLSQLAKSQVVTNGSLNGSPVGNSQVTNGAAAGWSSCGFSPDLCNTTYPSYLSTSQIPSSPSPDGGNWLGVASLGECAQTTITGLTPGTTYTLYFCGACFGTAALFNGSPATPQVCVGATCQTYSFPQGPNWNSLSLVFTATSATMTLQVKASSAGNYYASLDGFNLVGPCSPPQLPIAKFGVNDTDICVGTCLSFTDSTINNPSNWAWTFAGATPATSTQQNPSNICYNTPGTYTATLTASNGFGNSSYSRTIKVNAPVANSVNAAICTGDSILINGVYRSSEGAYLDTLISSLGCDSFLTVNLTLLQIATFSQNLAICTGDSVLVNGVYLSTAGMYIDTLNAANGCDSIVTTSLSLLAVPVSSQAISICTGDSVLVHGIYRSAAGVYMDTLTAANGCDSIVTTNLSLLVVPVSSQNISICTGDSVLVNGVYRSAAGAYMDTLTAANGCDSIVTTNLSLLVIPVSSQAISICNGDSVLVHGIYRNAAGAYIDTLKAANGCDSLVNTTLALLPIPTSSQAVSICSGDSVLVNGVYRNTSGVYIDTLTAANGCDSLMTTTLTLLPVSMSSQSISICEGDSVLINGVYLSTAGNYVNTLTATNGCDSIITTTLTLLAVPVTSQTISICTGDSLLINGLYVSAAGNYADTLTATNGCDSVVNTLLTLTSMDDINLGSDTSLCPGEALLLDAALPRGVYQWQDNSTNATYTVIGKGLYWVKVTADNCLKSDTILVDEDETGCNCFLFTPNAFTPNNDGNNDRFNVSASCTIVDIHLMVFNRWGEKVYDTYDELYGWDGTYSGQAAPAGVYVYLINYRLAKGNFVASHGTVTLIR